MKKAIIILFIYSIASAWGGFCAGFKQGYKDGACYQQYGCIAPIPPLCPVPRIGEDSYQGGYNRGFLSGLNR